MKFFSIVCKGVAVAWSAKKLVEDMASLATQVGRIEVRNDNLKASSAMARCAEGLSCLTEKVLALTDLTAPERSDTIGKRMKMAVDSLRVASGYYFHAGRGEPMGPYVVLAGEALQKQWSDARLEVLNDDGQGLGSLVNMFAIMAIASIGIGMRGQAENLASKGALTADLAEELGFKVRSAMDDAIRIERKRESDINEKERSNPRDSASVKASREEARVKREEGVGKIAMGCANEEAQIYFLGGLKEKALEALRRLDHLPSAGQREAARVNLAKELYFERGNGAEFCGWAIEVLGLKNPKSAPAVPKI